MHVRKVEQVHVVIVGTGAAGELTCLPKLGTIRMMPGWAKGWRK